MKRVQGRNIYIVKLREVMNATGGVNKFVRRCEDSTFSAIWIRLGYGRRLDPNLRIAEFRDIQSKLKAKGIEIWGWHLPRCPTMARATEEAEFVVDWAREYDLEGVLLDAESGDNYFQGGEDEADRYARTVRQGLAALGKGIALSTHDAPRFFPQFPFSTFLKHVEDNCPQVYYTGSVSTRLSRSIQQYRVLEAGRDFQDRYKPVGNITIRGDVPIPDPQECVDKAAEFMGLVARNGFKAYSFWVWDEAPNEIWPLFKNTEVFRAEDVRVFVDNARAAAVASEISEFDIAAIATDVEDLRYSTDEDRSEFYDTILAPVIEELALRVEDQPDRAAITRWLQVQSMTMDFAVEGVSEVTLRLWRRSPDEVRAAVATLPVEQQVRISRLLSEFDSDEVPLDLFSRFDAALLAPVSRGRGGILGEFVGERTFTSNRGHPVVQGQLKMFDGDGELIGSFLTNSGGGARSSRHRNGPTPSGTYRVSHHRPNRTTTGMVLHGVGFSFDVDATDGTPVYGRSLFRIHPDGGTQQTNGCLGLRLPTAADLREAERMILELMRQNGGSFKISVRHGV